MVSNVRRLVEILTSLNNLIKNYSIYIYVIDSTYRLIWANRYSRDKFHLTRLPLKGTCHRLLWNLEEKCDNCPTTLVMDESQIQRHILRKRMVEDGDKEVFFRNHLHAYPRSSGCY